MNDFTAPRPNVLTMLRNAYRISKDLIAGLPDTTGRKWKRPARICPAWCAGNHTCTARHGYPSGEHRSEIQRWNTHYGVLLATHIQTIHGDERIDLSTRVQLSNADDTAGIQRQLIPLVVSEAIKATLLEIEVRARGATATITSNQPQAIQDRAA